MFRDSQDWRTLALVVAVYGAWAALLFLPAGLPAWLIFLLIIPVMTLHSSLQHECLHGHPTRKRLVNEALVTLPLSLAYPYRRYKATHLAHHHDERLTDPFDDPESYYRARWHYDQLPRVLKRLLAANNTLLGRMLLGPWLVAGAFFLDEARLIRAGAPGVRQAWAIHLPALALVLALVWAMGIPLWLYLLAVCWPGLALIAIRTFAEHQWHETPEGRTIIVERSPLAWLFLNNNLHIVHHKTPSAPWYALPRLYRERREEWQSMNGGYVFPNYLALWRRWGLWAKEPVVHPVLHREAPLP